MEALNIDLIANDGSPIGVIPPDIYGKGVGGAELAMMSLMQTFAERGHEVRVYNDPLSPGDYEGVNYIPRKMFNPRAKRDVLIVFRSPNPLMINATAELGIFWWSTDQYTVGSFTVLAEKVRYCVTISPYHTQYHIKTYRIDPNKIGHIDLGVRMKDYSIEVAKVPGQMIFCSVPDRGLRILHAAWPLIKRTAPQASLIITSDYRLWGVGAQNARHRLDWAGMPDVTFLGKVPRHELVKYQLQSEVLPYPCTYEELFCLSVAEAQVAGCFPVTTPVGALATTNEFGIQITGQPTSPMFVEEFSERVAGLVTTERTFLENRLKPMIAAAKIRFDWNRIAGVWEELFEKGELSR